MLLAARMLLLASSASALVVGGAAASRSSLSALDAPLVTMQARDDWKFGTGAPLGYKRGVGGTGREEKALPNEKGAFLSSEDEFRHGTGSVAPKPLGGVMAFGEKAIAAGGDDAEADEAAGGEAAGGEKASGAKASGEEARQRIKQRRSWLSAADEFRHGTGSVGGGTLGGP